MNRTFLQLSGQAENRFYGHIDILAKYCGLTNTPWLNGYLQHGWNGCDGFSNYAGYKRISKKFIWSKRALNDQEKLGGKNNFVIGSPWLYNLKNLNFQKKTTNSEKIIAYPLHSQPWAPKNYLHSEYANFLKSKYGKVTVSLHWSDFDKKELKETYQNLGHDVITSGVGTPWLEGFNNQFLLNQVNHLNQHSVLTTNAMQTSVLYAMSLGLKIDFGGPASWVKKNDEIGTYGNYGESYWRLRVSNDYESLWKEELGFNNLKDKENLLDILDWRKPKLKLTFLVTRFIDLTRDSNFSEKISYTFRGKRK